MSRIYGLVMQAIISRVGSKTDGANKAGTLHAKVKELRDSLLSSAIGSVNPVVNIAAEKTLSGGTSQRVIYSWLPNKSGIAKIQIDLRVYTSGTNEVYAVQGDMLRGSSFSNLDLSALPSDLGISVSAADITGNGLRVAHNTVSDGTYATYTGFVTARKNVPIFFFFLKNSSNLSHYRNFKILYDGVIE